MDAGACPPTPTTRAAALRTIRIPTQRRTAADARLSLDETQTLLTAREFFVPDPEVRKAILGSCGSARLASVATLDQVALDDPSVPGRVGLMLSAPSLITSLDHTGVRRAGPRAPEVPRLRTGPSISQAGRLVDGNRPDAVALERKRCFGRLPTAMFARSRDCTAGREGSNTSVQRPSTTIHAGPRRITVTSSRKDASVCMRSSSAMMRDPVGYRATGGLLRPPGLRQDADGGLRSRRAYLAPSAGTAADRQS